MSNVCPKCSSSNITFKHAQLESFGMETLKGIAKAGYWGFKITSNITENFGHPGKLASLASRAISKAIDNGAEEIPTNVRKYHCNKCGHNWGHEFSKY